MTLHDEQNKVLAPDYGMSVLRVQTVFIGFGF